MSKTLSQLAAELGLSATALQAFLKQRGDLRCVDEEATFSDMEAEALREAVRMESSDAPNAGVVGMTVNHFKAFGTPQQVKLRPITLVFGQNSVGKSSFLHALLWAQHVAATGELDVVNPLLAGNSVHLGGFDNVVFRRHAGDAFSIGFAVQAPPMGAFLPHRLHFCVRTSFCRPSPTPADLTPDPVPVEYSMDIEDLPFLKGKYRGAQEGFSIDEIDIDHPLMHGVFMRLAGLQSQRKPLSKKTIACLRRTAKNICAQMRLQGGHLLPKRAVMLEARPKRGTPRDCANTDTIKWVPILEAALPQLIHTLVSTAAERVSDYLRSLSYLGPLRAYPDRSFSLNDQTDPNWRAGGGQAWELLRDEAPLREEVNQFLGKKHLQTGYEFRLNHFVDTDAAAKKLAQAFKAGMTPNAKRIEASLETAGLPHHNELVLFDLKNRMQVSHRDVGVGLSQVVPVLVLAAAGRNKTVIVEQPELHIHPALQADLGDIFLKSALLHGNRFVLETHSEHLMLRLLKRVRQSNANDPDYPAHWPKLSPEMISVVYAKATDEGTQFIPIALSNDGDFLESWPDGFFTERARELFS